MFSISDLISRKHAIPFHILLLVFGVFEDGGVDEDVLWAYGESVFRNGIESIAFVLLLTHS